MHTADDYTGAHSGECKTYYEESLNLFVDGELALNDQATLFAHLAVCGECRQVLDSVMAFRRFSREEHLSVPPGLDDAFLKRLARSKAARKTINRPADRRPLWQARTAVTVRSAVVAAVVVFVAGLLLPAWLDEQPRDPVVQGREERVEFADQNVDAREAVLYVFYPGLTVEAAKADEDPSPGPL